MGPVAQSYLVVGVLLLAGVAADVVARRIRLPRVTLLVLLGVLAGPAVLDVLPPRSREWFPVVSTVALVTIGFLVGGEFTRDRLRRRGAEVALVAVVQALVTALAIGAGLLALGFGAEVALPLAGIGAATAPASTIAVVQEHGGSGWLPRTMVGVVALNDVVTVVLFSALVSVATVVAGTGDAASLLGTAAWEVGGAVLVALVLGGPVALLTGRLRPGEPTREEAVGVVLVCAGLAVWLDVSAVLTAVVLGAVVANLAAHHERPFRAIENVEWLVLVVFFVLAGAELEPAQLVEAGGLGAAFVALRTAGKVVGGGAAARAVGRPPDTQRWLGVALLPQAGVALGLALLALERFPEVGDRLLAVVVASTVLFEVAGTALCRVALRRVGDRP